MLASYEHLAWYAQILNNQANIRTFYVYEQPASAYLDWRWPLRIGFLPDEEGIAHQMRFQAWLHEKEWAQGILRLVDSQASETTVDILFLPDALTKFSQIEMAPVPVLTANCLFAFSYNGDTLDSFAAHLADYQALTQAKGFVYATRQQPPSNSGWTHCSGSFLTTGHLTRHCMQRLPKLRTVLRTPSFSARSFLFKPPRLLPKPSA